jgi:hypothetical protein
MRDQRPFANRTAINPAATRRAARLVDQRLLNAEPAASEMSGNTDKADWQGRGSDKLQGEGAGQQAKGDPQQLKGTQRTRSRTALTR